MSRLTMKLKVEGNTLALDAFFNAQKIIYNKKFDMDEATDEQMVKEFRAFTIKKLINELLTEL